MNAKSGLFAVLRERTQRVTDSAARDDRPTLPDIIKRVEELLLLGEKIERNAAGIRNNVMIPVEGRRKQLQDATTENVKQVQALENAIAGELRALGNERRFRERLPAAPTDPVSIQIRSELRANLRSMDSQQRLALARIEKLDPETLAAILEAPPGLSGLPAPIVDNLRTQLVATKGTPDFSAVDSEISALTTAALNAARQSAGEASEMEGHAFASRVAGVRAEMTAGVDHTDADLPTLLAIAAQSAAA